MELDWKNDPVGTLRNLKRYEIHRCFSRLNYADTILRTDWLMAHRSGPACFKVWLDS